jgi:hypothetical protein
MRWCVLLCATVCLAADSNLDRVADRYFDEYLFRFNPTQGTSAGFHQYDTQVEDLSKTAIQDRIRTLHRFQIEFSKLASTPDRDLLLANIQSALLEFETIRMWQHNPDMYSSLITSSAFTIMSRSFAPPADRLKSLIERERRMPKLLEDGRVNVVNPPRVYVEVAIEQMPGLIGFFEKDVPAAFSTVKDAKLLGQFEQANSRVIASLQQYRKHLETLLPQANGDFRIGAENYRKKLLYDEMVDTPLDRLLDIGYRNLRENQAAFRAMAKLIDPRKTAEGVMAEVEKDHPSPDRILQSFRDVLDGLRNFIERRQIVTIPSRVLPILEETPPFMRALTSASMDTPGPYERVAKEGFFNVTLPSKNLSPREVEEFMGSLGRGTILSTAIHEAYPGHYTQFLWIQNIPSKIRKLVGAGSNAEGWAHYTEQMMLDEGFTTDPKMRLGQLRDALLRNVRYIVGIRMHTGDMTMAQAEEYFVKEGFQTRPTAVQETKRGTSDPTYLVYTLGKLQILKLREDYRKQRGSKFTLMEFHNKFMEQGSPPIKIVRGALLGDLSPVL